MPDGRSPRSATMRLMPASLYSARISRIDSRVEEVVQRVRSRAETEGFDPVLAERIWRQLIDWSIAREEQTLGR